ncbi:MAG: fibronectin type III domain-containing protein, partial [Pirellulaceae bacterium]
MRPGMIAGLLACWGCAANLLAHEGHAPPPKAKPAEVYKPTVLPDRIVLTWADDPVHTQAVTWRTSTEVEHGLAEITVAEANPGFPKQARRVDAVTVPLTTDLSAAHYHSVRFVDLEPATKYAYRVGDGVNWSEWFHFATASDKPQPFSFIYFGDAQNDIRSMWSRVIREAYSDAPKAKFLLHAGDLINNAESDAEWGEWFGAGHWLNAMIPNVPVPGNHEQARGPNGRRLSHHWRPQFTLPENGPPGLEESCYTFVYQNVRLIGLDSNRELDTQRAWLDEVLTSNHSEWVVCTFHHPVFSTAKE